jgi:hypothetical protein
MKRQSVILQEKWDQMEDLAQKALVALRLQPSHEFLFAFVLGKPDTALDHG